MAMVVERSLNVEFFNQDAKKECKEEMRRIIV